MRESSANAAQSQMIMLRDASFATTNIAPTQSSSAPPLTATVSTSTSTSSNMGSSDTRPRTAPTGPLYMRHRFASAAQFSSQFGMSSVIRVGATNNGFVNGTLGNNGSSNGGGGGTAYANGRVASGGVGELITELMTPIRSTSTINIRPQFRTKVVCDLKCGDCGILVCQRGMRAILLADTNVELFSTDCPPIGLSMVNDDYVTRNCNCRIRDVACLNCGNLVGYHVTQPCDACMEACNNGHFWMFHIDSVKASERMDGSKVLLWSQLMFFDKEPKDTDFVCR